MEKTLGLYPAPLAILDVVEHGLSAWPDDGLRLRGPRFGGLAMTEEAKSLMHLFFGQTALKKNRFGAPAKKARRSACSAPGSWARASPTVSAQQGLRVLHEGRLGRGLARGQKAIWQGPRQAREEQGLTRFERERIASHVTCRRRTCAGFEHADLVIEAVFEDLSPSSTRSCARPRR
jgi:hypothetical protein